MTLRRPSALVLCTLALAAALTVATSPSHARPPQRPGADADLVERGRQLFLTGCSSCHGVTGGGVRTRNGQFRGPSLRDAGEASAYYYLTTGRMPLPDPGLPPERKDPAYSPAEIEALVAYVGSLGDGPKVPDVDPDQGNPARGGVLFRQNCAPCHSATGAGGALSYGRSAPTLSESEPLQVGTAVRTGPGQMPRFGRDTLSDAELDSVAAYVRYLRDPDDRGGVALGRIGPIPEGFFVWLVGLGALVAASVWIARRFRDPVSLGSTPGGAGFADPADPLEAAPPGGLRGEGRDGP